MPDDTGWLIGGRYRVTDRLGSGGMAEVFRAHDEMLDRDVAVKVFRTGAATADTAAGVERQRAELHALARLNHPNLITLYDGSVGDTTGGPTRRAYLVMELVEGPNLGDRIDRGPLPTEAEVRVVGAQVADALAYVHAQGMVHRDVKPANILLGPATGDGVVRARLSDFGIVRLLDAERMTSADSTLGTASYLAPEQARGSAVGPSADVYALGLTLVEALTGVRSFDGPTPIEAAVQRLERDPDIPRDLPHPWPALLTAMTARDPAARPDAAAVARALREDVGAGTTQLVPPLAAAGATTVLPAAAGAGLTGAGFATAGAAGTPAVPLGPRPSGPPPRRMPVGLLVGLLLALVLVGIGALVLVATSGGGGDAGTGTSTTPSVSRTPSTDATTSAPSTSGRSSSDDNGGERSRSRSRTRSASSSAERTTSSAPSTRTSSSSAPSSSASSAPSSSSAAGSSSTAQAEPVAPATTSSSSQQPGP